MPSRAPDIILPLFLLARFDSWHWTVESEDGELTDNYIILGDCAYNFIPEVNNDK